MLCRRGAATPVTRLAVRSLPKFAGACERAASRRGCLFFLRLNMTYDFSRHACPQYGREIRLDLLRKRKLINLRSSRLNRVMNRAEFESAVLPDRISCPW